MTRDFRIGEMAKLFGMNIRTLRYYDQIGLLNPVRVDPDTGYRYYSVEQFEQLNTIRYLRTQGVGLEDIRSALERRDPAGIRALLRRQEEAVARQLEELENTRARLAGRIKQIDDVMDLTLLDCLRIAELSARPVAVLDRSLRAGDNLELPLRSLERCSGMAPSYFLGKVGLTMAGEDLARGRFDRYRSLFCLLEPGEAPRGAEAWLPGGLWAFWRFRGSHADAGPQYEAMLGALNRKGLLPAGDGVEFALVDFGLTEDPSQFMTELQLPVRPQ